MWLWNSFKHWLKWKLCEQELLELNSYRNIVHDYDRWCAEFPEVDLVTTKIIEEVKSGNRSSVFCKSVRDYLRAAKKAGVIPDKQNYSHVNPEKV